MEASGEGARDLLTALAQCNDELRTFAYNLYLRQGGSRWTQSLVISGKPFTISTPTTRDIYERCYIPSVSLHLSHSRSIAFSIYLCFDSQTWMVEASIEVNDLNEDETEYLWELPGRRTGSLDEAVVLLVDATQQLIRNGENLDMNL